MSGKGKQDKRKRDAHTADMTQHPPLPAWVNQRQASRPEWDDTYVVPYPVPGSGKEVQIVQRTRRQPETGQLVDFAVTIQFREDGTDEGWCDIARVDCEHGYVHVDRMESSGASVKDRDCIPSGVGDDLDKALSWALDYIWDVDERLKGWA